MRNMYLASSIARLALAAAAVLPCLAGGVGQSQTDNAPTANAGQDAPLIHLDVRRVPVDLVVLDKQGKPVQGLTRDDFAVKEDGTPQQIMSFDSVDGSAPSFVPPKLPQLPANTFVNVPGEAERGPLYILYYDMVNTPEEDQMAFHARLLKFVDDAQPGTRMALFVNAAGLHLVQGFTSDHALLKAAILRKGPGPHIPDVFTFGKNYGTADWGAALSNLKFIAEYMEGLPGRKNLIWMASIFPIPVGPSVQGNAAMQTASQASTAGSVGSQGGPQVLDLDYLAEETIKHAYAAMMRAQVALYPVSLRGVAGASAGGASADSLSDYRNMDAIAAATGGRAYYNSNHPEALIDKAVSDGESYYTLSYAPTNTKYDGSQRKIAVTLANGANYTLAYRTIYYAVSDNEEKPKLKEDPMQKRFTAVKDSDTLYANIEHGAPMLHDLLFSAHLAAVGSAVMATPAEMMALVDSPTYFKTRKKDSVQKPLPPVKLQKYVIDYGVIDPQLKVEAKRRGTPAVLEFAAAAYDMNGKLLNSQLNNGVASTDLKAQGKAEGTFRAEQELEVPPGATSIRVAVRDKGTDRTGTLEVTLPLQGEGSGKKAKGGA